MSENIGRASKGSRYCLQNYILKNPNELTKLIIASSPSLLSFSDGKIEWVSPVQSNDFYEYRDDFLRGLSLKGINIADAEVKLRSFWPKNGPQWDGLAIVKNSEGEKGVLLVEAKAYPKETKSDLKAESQKSIDLIKKSLTRAQEYMGVRPSDWTKNHYQLANRISFLYYMTEILKIPTWLILINFVNDTSYKKTDIGMWLNEYHEIYKNMGIHKDCELLNYIIQIFPNVIT